MSDALEALKRMIGIPASVGVCEPVEGFVERPQDAVDCMREMAAEIKRLRAAPPSTAEAQETYIDTGAVQIGGALFQKHGWSPELAQERGLKVIPLYRKASEGEQTPPSTAESRGQLEQAYMAGQADLGIDPCWSSAQDYASKIRGSKPSTAEAVARALDEMAEEIYQRSLGDDMSESSKDMLCYASGMVRLKAKRIREEG